MTGDEFVFGLVIGLTFGFMLGVFAMSAWIVFGPGGVFTDPAGKGVES
ncbi:MAG: hypothetical protein KAT93_07860 [Desulfuromonadales bacterium]|nr:hypothetical protein [Desulfuromonadales bacterium]